MERRCQKINIFIFGMLLPWISTFGAARRDKKQKVVHKDRRAAMLQKGRKTPADSEFCERQRNAFATEGNKLFFVGCDMQDNRQYNTAALLPIIKRLPWLGNEKEPFQFFLTVFYIFSLHITILLLIMVLENCYLCD